MSVEIQEGGVQVSQVENQDSILSFNVEGEFDSAEAKDLQESNRRDSTSGSQKTPPDY
jgi:hypothetical protein